MKNQEIIDRFSEFLTDNYYKDLSLAVTEGRKYLQVDFSLVDKFDPELADAILEKPEETIRLLEKSVGEIDLPEKIELRIRFFNIPDSNKIRIRNIRAEHIGKLLCVDGIVKRASEVRPEVAESVFECPECGKVITVIQTEKDKTIRLPGRCECGCRRGFRQVEQKLYDARWIAIEEPFEITTGERPSEIMVYFKEDLTSPRMRNKTDPGNRIKVIGILKEIPRRTRTGRKTRQREILLDANNVEAVEVEWEELIIDPEDERKIKRLAKDPRVYEKLVASLAPTMYGMDDVKLAVILQLFGGEPKLLKDGTRIRGNIHLLLVGDPASGKSQLMQLTSKLIPRGKYVSGRGVTGPGLCVTHDTIVALGDGTLIPIGDLVEEELKAGCLEIKPGVFVAEVPTPKKILSFDTENFKIRSLKITQYWKIKAPKRLVKIKTRMGKEIITTLDNPIPTVINGRIVWKKASELTTKHYVATPRILDVNPKSVSTLEFIDKTAHLINSASLVNKLIEKIKQIGIRKYSKRLGISEDCLYYSWRDEARRGNPTLGILEKICNDFGYDLENILPPKLVLFQYHGHTITIPSEFNEDLMYLVGLLAGDGSLSETAYGGCDIKFHNTSLELLDTFHDLCQTQLSIEPREDERFGVPYFRFNSKILRNILEKFGIPNGDKSHKMVISQHLSKLPNNLLAAFLRGLFDTDGSSNEKKDGSGNVEISSASKTFINGLQILLLRFGILSRTRERKATRSIIRGRTIKSGKKWVLEIDGLRNLSLFKEKIGFGFSQKSKKLKRIIDKITREDTNVDVIPEIGSLLRKARQKIGLSAKKLYGYKNYSYEKGRRRPSRRMLIKLLERLKEHGVCEEISTLEKFALSDIFWDEVKEVMIVDNKDHEYVYDVTVENEHSFVANGLIVHNTATVVRDEQFLGGWVLEAGALVMTNRSLCCIDEFSKVAPQDQVALQEAMSLGTISIAKASIVATLPAQTAILAGGNPKLGRFDPYIPIKEQVPIDEVLLSRFDLRFALRDVPNPEVDAMMADHILKMRHFEEEEAKPIIEPELLRKYLAYAKSQVHPVLTKEAAETIKDFYLKMRAKAGGEAPVSITLRQYEALMRIAEASAKVRLSNKIDVSDAERAIRLMKTSLRQFGFDPETGMIDIDRAEGAITSAQRSKIRIVLDVIEELTKAIGKNIPEEELIRRAREEGVDDVDDILRRMKNEGLVFSSRPGFVSKV